MYRIKVRNIETGVCWYEYGFGGFTAKRIAFLLNERTTDYYQKYEIENADKLNFSLSAFKKCLVAYSIIIE